ncbi:hypothetical protein, partial [Salmonella enterica]|uniref:hypothetical protein n=1 Tax=Salmonella enterica TaxID=28901 RepID=UPI00117BAE50
MAPKEYKKADNISSAFFNHVTRPEERCHVPDLNPENVMMTEFKRTQRDYPLSFKIADVEQAEKCEMTYKQ